MSDGFKDTSGYFNVSGEPADGGRSVEVTLSRDGSNFNGTWVMAHDATDPRMSISSSSGTWQLSGFCDDKGDHNTVYLYAGDAGSLVITITDVATNFLSPWQIGRNFVGAGTTRGGTKIDYLIGVACG